MVGHETITNCSIVDTILDYLLSLQINQDDHQLEDVIS